MYIKGYKVRRSNAIGFRNADPTRDKDLDGEPVESNYAAFVRIKDCETEIVTRTSGRRVRVYKAATAPSIPITYFGTYYGAGKYTIKRDGKWFKLSDGTEVYDEEYVSIPMYFARDGYVYVCTKYNRLCNMSESVVKTSKLPVELVNKYKEKENQRTSLELIAVS